MPEYLWSRMFFNILGFLIYLNKNKYGWINLENARICLKYNVKNTVKYSIFKRKAYSELYQTTKMELLWKMFNMVLWIYLGVWMCFGIRICQGSGYARDTQGSEYVWEYVRICSEYVNIPNIMLEDVWICLKQNLK